MEQRKEDLPVLVAQVGPLEGQRWPVDGILSIGRDPSCDLVITTPDKQVSRRHAQLTLVGEQVELRDMGSKNGTQLNGKLIDGPVLLEDGDTIQIAMAQQLVFLASDATVPLQLEQSADASQQPNLLKLDRRARRVWIGEREVVPPLSVAQYTMLELLDENESHVVSRQDLIIAVWGQENAYEVSNQALDALVRRLRDRLGELHEHEFIVTVRGHGLRLDNPQG